jgi:hypothetical protein
MCYIYDSFRNYIVSVATMTMISQDIKVITSTEFIKTFSSSMFKLKKYIKNGEIKATKRNGRYLIDAESANKWHKSLFSDHDLFAA